MLLCAILALEDGRDALAVLARRTASAIQKTSIDRVNIGPGSDVHTIDDDVEPNTPIYVHVETQLPDLNAVDSSVSGIVEPSGAAQTGGLGDTSASVEAATPLATLFPLSASVDDSDTTSSVETSSVVGDSSSDSDEQTDDFLGDGVHYEISFDDEPIAQIRRHSINTPRQNVSIPQPVFDNSAPHDNGVAPVVLARVVPPHLAPFVIDNGPFGLSQFQLGVSHAPTPIHWISFSENAVQCRNDELYMDWFINAMPWDLVISGKRMVDSFREDGEMTYYTVDAGVRMFNEKEMVMMQGIGYRMWRCMVLANFAVQFLSTPGDYDLETAAKMFLPSRMGFSPATCRMIMAPVLLDDSRAWCLYAFDMHAKILNILDPVHTLQYQEVMAGLHAADADLFLAELGEVGLALVEGFTINRDEWDIEYNIGINNPCSVNESIVYLFHYARNFTRANLAEQIDEDGLVVLQKKLFYDIMVMDDNAGETRGLMER
ncbi:hypothetical protein ZWY2020_016922 [Hordeum vulgare]|nr:hypothetical protein ZWY2020_016922 [Hordeum vulgare]